MQNVLLANSNEQSKPRSAASGETFDVIIIGGGAAGCVVAGKLASNTSDRVLLLEAGMDDFDPLIHLPAGYSRILQHDLHVWPYETVPQNQLDGKVRRFRSGKVIGGGSSINAMCYVRGQPRDYEQWQEAVGSSGAWSYSDMLPHFRAQEGNDTFHNEYHGTSGSLKVSMPQGINELNQGCMKAFQEFGLPYNPDYNGRSQLGVSPVQATLSHSRRCSSADAFLKPAVHSERVEVRVQCVVERILFEDGAAVGVQYLHGGKKTTVFANDIILSAGAVHSPKLLMLSGVGPKMHLEEMGIAVIHDAPEVGKNLQDHPVVPVKAYCKTDIGYQNAAQGIGAIKAGLRYVLTKDGPASGNGVETVSYFDPDNLEGEPTIQCYHVPIVSEDGLSPTGTKAGITFELVVLRPKSRGSVRLRDADPNSMPIIDPNYMDDPADMAAAIKSVRAMRKVMEMPSLRDLLEPELEPGLDVVTDTQIAEWIGKVVTTMWHPVGTCRMGNDAESVVDPELRVRGVTGLRVIDASIMPNIVSGNTNAPTMALADRGVELFLKSRKRTSGDSGRHSAEPDLSSPEGRTSLIHAAVHGLPSDLGL
jgi:choline dehydrogenase-like flavoprotein